MVFIGPKLEDLEVKIMSSSGFTQVNSNSNQMITLEVFIRKVRCQTYENKGVCKYRSRWRSIVFNPCL